MNAAREIEYSAVGRDAPRPGLPFVKREVAVAIVYDPKMQKYLGLRWKKVPWETFVSGGVEGGQSSVEAARAEVLQESGYKNLRLVSELPHYYTEFYHAPKGENHRAHYHAFFFELMGEERDSISIKEQAKHECVWLSLPELQDFRLPEGQRMLLKSITR